MCLCILQSPSQRIQYLSVSFHQISFTPSYFYSREETLNILGLNGSQSQEDGKGLEVWIMWAEETCGFWI